MIVSPVTIAYVILAVLIALNMFESVRTQKILTRHQKALEWFARHVDLDPSKAPKDSPPEVYDLLHVDDDDSKNADEADKEIKNKQ